MDQYPKEEPIIENSQKKFITKDSEPLRTQHPIGHNIVEVKRL